MKFGCSFLILIIGFSLAQSYNVFDTLQMVKNLQDINGGKLRNLLRQNVEFSPEIIAHAFEQTANLFLKPHIDNGTVFDEEDPWFTPQTRSCLFQLLAMARALLGNRTIIPIELHNSYETEEPEGPQMELWPLIMIDAWAKISSGFASGNIRNPGHYRQCLNFRRQVNGSIVLVRPQEFNEEIRGQHCTLALQRISGDFTWPELPVVIQPPDFIFDIGGLFPGPLFIEQGMCFPAACNATIVEYMVRFIGLYLNLEPAPFFTNNTHHFCQTDERPELSDLDIGALTLIILGFAGCILSTIYEVTCRKMKWTVYEAGAAMSFYSNGRYLFNLRRNPDHAQALYGIRALALIWLMLGYRFILSLVAPLINPVAFVTELGDSFFSVFVMGSQFGIDALLFANAALITFIFMNKIDRTGRVRIWKMYIYRFMRVTPFIGILIFFSMTLTKFSNDGPYYSFFTEAQIPACEEYWWSAMLHVQNYVNPDTICLLHTFFFSVDMQLFWAAPLVLFPLYFFGGWVLLFVFLMMGLTIGCAVSVSYFYEFMVIPFNMIFRPDVGVTIYRIFEYLRMIYFATHIRMGPWLIGVFCGYIMFRNRDKKFKLNWIVESLLWIISISGVIAVLALLYPFNQYLDNDTGVWENALYIGFARNILALCLAWMVYGTFTGSGLLINWILSLQIWMPISRMGISIYLVSLSAQVVQIASQKAPYVYGIGEMLQAYMGDILIVIIFSTVTFLMIERPIMRCTKTLLSIGTKKTQEKPILNGRDEVQEELTFSKTVPWKSFY